MWNHGGSCNDDDSLVWILGDVHATGHKRKPE